MSYICNESTRWENVILTVHSGIRFLTVSWSFVPGGQTCCINNCTAIIRFQAHLVHTVTHTHIHTHTHTHTASIYIQYVPHVTELIYICSNILLPWQQQNNTRRPACCHREPPHDEGLLYIKFAPNPWAMQWIKTTPLANMGKLSKDTLELQLALTAILRYVNGWFYAFSGVSSTSWCMNEWVMTWVFMLLVSSPCLMIVLVLFPISTLPEDYMGAIL